MHDSKSIGKNNRLMRGRWQAGCQCRKSAFEVGRLRQARGAARETLRMEPMGGEPGPPPQAPGLAYLQVR
jgi:hypothetical protein